MPEAARSALETDLDGAQPYWTDSKEGHHAANSSSALQKLQRTRERDLCAVQLRKSHCVGMPKICNINTQSSPGSHESLDLDVDDLSAPNASTDINSWWMLAICDAQDNNVFDEQDECNAPSFACPYPIQLLSLVSCPLRPSIQGTPRCARWHRHGSDMNPIQNAPRSYRKM